MIQTMKKTLFLQFGILFILLCFLVTGCSIPEIQTSSSPEISATLENIPAYSGEPYVVLNDNQPDFAEEDMTNKSFENYGELDSLGRCTTAVANIGQDLMPTEERGQISPVKPSGWKTAKYDCVEGKYLYNRCHLIGFQLSGENANPKNLITGTRYLNVDGMLPFENQVADYVKSTGNHVLYRVTPIFEGENLVADGVQMEGWSVEDQGKSICFNIYAYNVQPGVEIDYATGDSVLAGESAEAGAKKASQDKNDADSSSTQTEYVLNTNTKKIHLPSCSSVADTKEENKQTVTASKGELQSQGYEPCGRCKP